VQIVCGSVAGISICSATRIDLSQHARGPSGPMAGTRNALRASRPINAILAEAVAGLKDGRIFLLCLGESVGS
jgi:hypothetical protein